MREESAHNDKYATWPPSIPFICSLCGKKIETLEFFSTSVDTEVKRAYCNFDEFIEADEVPF